MGSDDDEQKDQIVPSSKYGTRRKGRLGRHDGRNIKRLWKAMVKAGALYPDGTPLSSTEVFHLENQPFSMNALTNHLANKPYLFHEAGRVKVASLDGRTSYFQSAWLVHGDAFDKD
jgi:hypothetical protein